jgi:hypothetical protein
VVPEYQKIQGGKIMAWIKFDHTTLNKPEVFLIKKKLSLNKAETIGYLVILWTWFDQISEGGETIGDLEIVDELTTLGFAETLVSIGWLEEIEGKLIIPNFDNHNGQTAKARAMDAKRKSDLRRTKSGLDKRREEKIRNNNILPNKPGGVLLKFKADKKTDKTPYAKIAEIWNNSITGTNCPKATRLSQKRKSQIKALCKEYTIEEITATFQKLVNIPFMTGQNQRGWIANIDYATRAEPFLRIFEESENNQKPDFDEWAN